MFGADWCKCTPLNPLTLKLTLTVMGLQPIPQGRREERPVSCFVPGSGPMQPNMASLARDAASLVASRERQRGFIPSVVCNETYGTMLDLASPPLTGPSLPGGPGVPVPPLPPRNPGKGEPSLRRTSPASQQPLCG